MAQVRLRTVTRTQGNNRALTNGEVAPATAVLEFQEVPVLIHAFRRMVRDMAYDVCEMAATTYLVARAYGKPFTALPVFLVRGFHHGAIQVAAGSGIAHPTELQGRRVGVNRGYTVTTGVWARGVLDTEHGVDLDSITWVCSGDEHVAAYRPPANVVAAPAGATLERMLLDGDLAAVVGAAIDHPDVVPLLPDADRAGYQALASRGYYPVNHLVVVRDEVLAAHPGLAADLFGAFVAAKQRYVEALRSGNLGAETATDAMYRRVMTTTGSDPLPYGIAPNRAVLDELVSHAVRQHILSAPPNLPALFAAGTRDLVG